MTRPRALAQLQYALLKSGQDLQTDDGPEAVARAIIPVLGGNVVISPRIAEQIGARFGQAVRHEREMESALADTSEQLDLLTSAKAEFLANVSHELRTPVTVAKGIAYVLKHRWIHDEEREEFLAKLEGSLEKLMTSSRSSSRSRSSTGEPSCSSSSRRTWPPSSGTSPTTWPGATPRSRSSRRCPSACLPSPTRAGSPR